ncbi:RusA family crossover junction endodeoxyribonuclease [Mangrovibacillus cuniculi]|uniref:RusA family crossover junction endodeoxyribonuclease n=1 Tax=Mangrovibacillus cuniculi TaxID=2593652 RepID=A0A7S8CBV5_9BACI|nr:RusA family crossover junction endodeoxyribonuclease [Mangrovibacillus cuniculi]QPC47129.1 RusA family crossover junction endodeoxyribonuclease [Mangrovibacillus cuniculi]
MISFTVYGEPVAQGRPRASTIAGRVRMYDPKKSRDFKQYVKLVAAEHKPAELLEGPLMLTVHIYKPTLKSFSKKKKEAAERGQIRPITKPDVDNYVKGIKDACNKVLWNDDSQIVDLSISKYYSVNPRIEVSVCKSIKPLEVTT